MRRVLLLLVAATPCAVAQGVPALTLGHPVAEFPEGFSNLVSLRELPDGRILVIEQCERVVRVIDFAGGTAVQWSRTGAGPGEYRIPTRLIAWPGDSSLLVDGGNRRLLVIDPAGRPGRMFPLPPAITSNSTAGTVVNAFAPMHADAQGRLYARNAGLRLGPGGAVFPDSLALERWDPGTGRLDTLAFHRATEPGRGSSPGPQPFLIGPQWALAPDGRLGIVDPRDYHAWFIARDGRRQAGAPIPFQAERISDGYKALWRREQQPACPARSLSFTTADGRTMNAVAAPTPEPTEWPDRLPPIRAGGVVFAPDGALWVRRTTPEGQPHAYDLLDATGRPTRRVTLPSTTRLLGFGRGALYLVRTDADDLQYLQKYRWP